MINFIDRSINSTFLDAITLFVVVFLNTRAISDVVKCDWNYQMCVSLVDILFKVINIKAILDQE